MITEQMLIEAIAECQGEREPDARTCYKLAAFYTILNEMRGKEPAPALPLSAYSQDTQPTENVVDFDSDSEFANAVRGMNSGKAWALVDELVATLWAVNKPLYNALMRRLRE